MGWKDSFLSGCQYTYKATGSILRYSIPKGIKMISYGTSAFGGLLYAVGYTLQEMQENLSAGYYVAGNLNGDVIFNATASEFSYSYSVTESFPIARNGNNQGSFTEDLNYYLHPMPIQMIALGFSASGVVLNMFGSTLDKWAQDTKEVENYRDEGVIISRPNSKEYLYTILSSGAQSLAISAITADVTFGAIIYSGYFTQQYEFTHPKYSSQSVNTSDYVGPVQQESFPIDITESRAVNFTIGFLTVPLDIIANINGTAEVTYGAGVTLTPKDVNPMPLIPLSVISGAALTTCGIFSTKNKKLHSDRLVNADKYSVLQSQNESDSLIRDNFC